MALRDWIRFTGAYRVPAVLVPVAAGSLYAVLDAYPFRWTPMLLALLGAGLAQISATTACQFLDHLREVEHAGRRSRPIPLLSPVAAAATCGIAISLALLVSALLVPRAGSAILGLGLVGFLIFAAYVVPPFALRDLDPGPAEFAVFLAFGPLAVLAGYRVQAGAFSLGAAFVSLPFGLLTAAVLSAHHRTRAAGVVNPEGADSRVAWRDALPWGLPALAFLTLALAVRLGELPATCLASIAGAIPVLLASYRLRRDESPDALRRRTEAAYWTAILSGLLIVAGMLVSLGSGP